MRVGPPPLFGGGRGILGRVRGGRVGGGGAPPNETIGGQRQNHAAASCCAVNCKPSDGEKSSGRMPFAASCIRPEIACLTRTSHLRRALAPDSDSVGLSRPGDSRRFLAARFLFDPEDLSQPVGRLSGGERARVLIAQLMLHTGGRPAAGRNPTTIWISRPSKFWKRVCWNIVEAWCWSLTIALCWIAFSTVVLRPGWVGCGRTFQRLFTVGRLAAQAAGEIRTEHFARPSRSPSSPSRPTAAAAKRKLSYLEAREFAAIEEKIAEADRRLAAYGRRWKIPQS